MNQKRSNSDFKKRKLNIREKSAVILMLKTKKLKLREKGQVILKLKIRKLNL